MFNKEIKSNVKYDIETSERAPTEIKRSNVGYDSCVNCMHCVHMVNPTNTSLVEYDCTMFGYQNITNPLGAASVCNYYEIYS